MLHYKDNIITMEETNNPFTSERHPLEEKYMNHFVLSFCIIILNEKIKHCVNCHTKMHVSNLIHFQDEMVNSLFLQKEDALSGKWDN